MRRFYAGFYDRLTPALGHRGEDALDWWSWLVLAAGFKPVGPTFREGRSVRFRNQSPIPGEGRRPEQRAAPVGESVEKLFVDHFGPLASVYARYRPRYPRALFDWLAEQCPGRTAAWDCGTGNGQAAAELASYFERVIATDASAAQIGVAGSAARVEFRVATAERSGLDSASIDLVTVAQALHWFDLERFYDEVRRVLVAHGRIAVWCYGTFEVQSPQIDALVRSFYEDTVGPFWPHERSFVENGYSDLPFPFTRVQAPSFEMTEAWNLDQLFGYICSWSATSRYSQARGPEGIEEFRRALAAAWGCAANTRILRWPLAVRAGSA